MRKTFIKFSYMIILHLIYGIVIVINLIQFYRVIRKKISNKNTSNKKILISKLDTLKEF